MAGETKFTPGPWVWNTGRPVKYDLCWLDGANGERILSMYGDGVVSPDKRLIAAAPDLLEALQSIERVAKSKGMTDADRKAALRDIAEHACAAIAKTKGA